MKIHAMLASTIALTALALPAAAQTAAPGKIEKIGLLVQDMSNPFFSAMDKGAQKAAAEIGASVNTQDASSTSPPRTTRSTRSSSRRQPDRRLGGHEVGLEPAIQRAKEAGIIVIAVDSRPRARTPWS